MSAALHLAGPDDAERLNNLAAAFHAEMGMDLSDDHRAKAVAEVCSGIPHAVAYLIGPRNAPLGYIILSMGFSLESGGLDCMIDEFFIRAKLRGRGIGSEALIAVAKMLSANGVKSIYLEVVANDEATQRLYAKLGFKLRAHNHLMARAL